MTDRLSELYSLSNEQSRIQPMEGLRGFAVVMVFMVHFQALLGHLSANHTTVWTVFSFLGNIGNTGVDFFFVLSGFLVYGALLRRKGSSTFKFIRRRIERIYPTFLVVFAIYLALSACFRSENKIHGHPLAVVLYIIENLLLLPGIFSIPPIITVAWSLSYEFFFYLILPAVILIAQLPRWNRTGRVLFFVGIWVGYIIYAFTVPHSLVRLLMFVSGILLYEVIDSGWLENRLTGKGEAVAALVFVVSLFLIYLIDAKPGWFSQLPGFSAGRTMLPGILTYQGPYKVILLSVTSPILILFCVQYRGVLQSIFTWNPMRYLGNMSYSYYLIHGLALQAVTLVTNLLFPNIHRSLVLFFVLFPVGFIATLVASTALFLAVEKPLSFKQKSMMAQKITGELETNKTSTAPAK